MRPLVLTVACLMAAGAAGSAQAQRFTVDLRPVIASPSELAGSELDVGLGFGATVAYQLQQHLHLYAGWDWLQFGANNSFAGLDRDFGETGYTFGLRFEHPLSEASRLLYRVEGGGTYKHVEIENQDGDIIADSDHSLGYELGLGLLWPAGNTWRFGPTFRFRSLDPDFDISGVGTSGTLRYMGLELSISRRF
jgi:hypothetical protein